MIIIVKKHRSCVICGVDFLLNSGPQVVCSSTCRREHKHKLRKLRWAILRSDPKKYASYLKHHNVKSNAWSRSKRTAERSRNRKSCVVCQGHFIPFGSRKTCSSGCSEKLRETTSKLYVAIARDRIRMNRRVSRINSLDHFRLYAKAYYAKNKSRIREIQKAAYVSSTDKINASRRKRRHEDAAYREKLIASANRRTLTLAAIRAVAIELGIITKRTRHPKMDGIRRRYKEQDRTLFQSFRSLNLIQ